MKKTTEPQNFFCRDEQSATAIDCDALRTNLIAPTATTFAPIEHSSMRHAFSRDMQAVARDFLTVPELAERLRIHPETVRRYAREGKIPCGRVGRNYRFPAEVVDMIKDKWLGGGDEE